MHSGNEETSLFRTLFTGPQMPIIEGFLCVHNIYRSGNQYFSFLVTQLELMVKFAAYVPELYMCQIDTLYFYNTNLAFKQCANKFANMSKVFSHIKVYRSVVGKASWFTST